MNQLDRTIRPEKRLLTFADIARASTGDPEAIAAIKRHIHEPENAPWLKDLQEAGEDLEDEA